MRILFFFMICFSLFAQLPKPGGSSIPGSGGGGGATSLAGLTDLQVTRTSATVLSVAAGTVREGTKVSNFVAATGTLSAPSATGIAYIYVLGGVLTMAHATAATLTCANCTTVVGSSFPPKSIPLATASFTASAWDVGGIVNQRALFSRSPLTAGDQISVVENAGGDQTISLSATPISVKAYLPLGHTTANGGNGTTVFTANETRWQWFTVSYPITFTKVLLYANTGIGASKGIRAAIADTAGTILYTSAVQTTCASLTICTLTFGSAVGLPPGQYFYGITTDSTTFNVYQEHFAYNNLVYGMQLTTGASIITMGAGTAGSGTAGSVAFGASMGTLTKWTGTDPVGKPIVVAFDN